jgi:ABC-type glutathione transport system ATPase component
MLDIEAGDSGSEGGNQRHMVETAILPENAELEQPLAQQRERSLQKQGHGRFANEPVFIARGLSKIYRMGDVEVHALRSVDLELYRGELVVLLGASGSGKSTLLNILGGLDVPTSGEVFYRDHNLSVDDDTELTRYRREHVGFVFQFYNLIPSLTAYENVELVTDIARNPMRPAEALRLVGLGDRMNHFPAPHIANLALVFDLRHSHPHKDAFPYLPIRYGQFLDWLCIR